MGPLGVVVRNPVGDLGAGMIETEEQIFVQQFVAPAAIETLRERILDRLARCDAMPVDARCFARGRDCRSGPFGDIVDKCMLSACSSVGNASPASEKADR